MRVRDVRFALFRLEGAQPGPNVELSVGRNGVLVTSGDLDRFRLEAPAGGDGAWHHVAFVSDRADNKVRARLYVDGALVASGPSTPPVDRVNSVNVGWLAAGDAAPARAKEEISGAVAACHLIGRPLTDAEVAALAGRKAVPAK